jgi:opacity protein-like surface antigen
MEKKVLIFFAREMDWFIFSFLLGFFFLTPSVWAFDLAWDLELYGGYDDNINRKEDKRKTESAFLSASPGVSLYQRPETDLTLTFGYEPVFTKYLSGDQGNQIFNSAWGEITARLKPRLYASAEARLEALSNDESPEDDGWGILASTGLTYHLSERLNAKLTGFYTRWRYDSLYFDTGRAVIRLDEHQVDDRWEFEAGVSYFLLLNSQVDLSYRFTYNASNNEIDEYRVQQVLVGIQTSFWDDFRMAFGYHFSGWDYLNWRAGRMLRGKLRDDSRHRFWISLEYSVSSLLSLLLNFERTHNSSNLHYESYDRNLLYGGIRFSWLRWKQ